MSDPGAMITARATHGERMQGQPDRIEQLKTDLADLRVTDPSAARDLLATRLGIAAMAAGVVLPMFAYFMSHGTTNPLAQRDAIILGLIGVAATIVGGALYLKGALAGFLRFWLVRDLHERRAQTDRVVRSLGGGEPGSEGEPT
jgi:uncharacterized membrane protein YidH (DUF202 family)